MKEIILEILKEFTREMQLYSYYGSNPGISEEDYEDLADKIVEKINAQPE